MDFDKLYDMFCEYYHDDGSNEEIMRGRIEKAFLKYSQTLVKNCSIPDVVGQSEQLPERLCKNNPNFKCNCIDQDRCPNFPPY